MDILFKVDYYKVIDEEETQQPSEYYRLEALKNQTSQLAGRHRVDAMLNKL